MDLASQEDLRRIVASFLADKPRRDAALLSAGYQGAAYLLEHDGRKLVIKVAGGGFFSGWLHRRMLGREARAYKLMAGVAGVPHSYGMPDNSCLALEFIDGISLKDARHDLLNGGAFYDRLRQVISDIHAAGVAHGDLKRKDNVLVTAGERPVVIDFGTAVTRNGGLFDRLFFRLFRRFDYNAWIKVKYARDYQSVSDADRQWYRPTIVERFFRVLLQIWRTLTFRQARKRKKRARNDSSS